MAASLQQLVAREAETRRLEEELRLAREIQQRLVPRELPERAELELAAYIEPAHEVGGDYYDVLPAREELAVVVADVAGKGISAALYMAELKGMMLSLAQAEPQPLQLVAEANRQLAGQLPRSSFITLVYVLLGRDGRSARLVRAGHCPPLHWRADTRELHALSPAGLGLGLVRDEGFVDQLEELELELGPGDVLLLYSDGLSEAMDAAGQQLGPQRLERMLTSLVERDAGQIQDGLLEGLRGFVGDAPQQDDLTLVVIKWR